MHRSLVRLFSTSFLFVSAGLGDAAWIEFELPNLAYAYQGVALSHLSDGRCLFGQNSNIYIQDSWSSPSFSLFDSTPSGVDPSFIAIWNDGVGAIGAGGWGSGPVYAFGPGDTSSPFSNVGLTLQTYHGVFRDATGLYTGGADTGANGDRHGLRYVTLDGSINKIVVDNVSVYSCGFCIDRDGNLYVGDNDDGSIRRFTAGQLDQAVSGSALTMNDGEFIHDFGGGGNITSVAIDGLGRLWAAGWAQDGIKVFDPALNQEFIVIPSLANANYRIASFIVDDVSYISYVTQEAPWNNDSQQFYGYDRADNYVVIPEPGTAGMVALAGLLIGANGIWQRRRA